MVLFPGYATLMVCLQIRRAALGQHSRPVLVRRARSTVTHDRPAVEGPGGAGPSSELNLGLAGVPLNAVGDRSMQGEAAGPGESKVGYPLLRTNVRIFRHRENAHGTQ